MSEELENIEIENIADNLVPEEVEVVAEEIVVEEEVVEEVKEKKKPAKAKKKKDDGIHKVLKIVQKKPSSYRLNVEGKGIVVVPKKDFDKKTMTVKL